MSLGLVKSQIWSHQHRAYGTALNIVHERLTKELDDIKEAGTWKAERVITTKQDVEIQVEGNKAKILNFCANNYLGLSVGAPLKSNNWMNSFTELHIGILEPS